MHHVELLVYEVRSLWQTKLIKFCILCVVILVFCNSVTVAVVTPAATCIQALCMLMN